MRHCAMKKNLALILYLAAALIGCETASAREYQCGRHYVETSGAIQVFGAIFYNRTRDNYKDGNPKSEEYVVDAWKTEVDAGGHAYRENFISKEWRHVLPRQSMRRIQRARGMIDPHEEQLGGMTRRSATAAEPTSSASRTVLPMRQGALMTQHAQIAERKYCRPHARPSRFGFPRKVPVFPVCSPATL